MPNETYYKPGLDDSEINVSPEEVDKFLGGTKTLENSGYIKRTPRFDANGYPISSQPAVPGLGVGGTPFMTQDQFLADRANKTGVNEAAIREEIRKNQQVRIDAINGAYNQMVSDANIRGTDRLGQNRAINARGGLLGSDFGAAKTEKVKGINASEVNAINAEREMKIQGVMDKIDQLTADRVKAQKDEALGNINAYKEYTDNAKATAKDTLRVLGESGVSYDDLKAKAPDQLKIILESTGYDEFTLAQIMNNNKKSGEKIDYTYKTIGNKIIGYGTNPRTGQIETVEKDIDLGEDNLQEYDPTVTPDGTLIMVPKKLDPSKPLNEQIKVFGAEGQYAKPLKGSSGGGGGGGGGGKKKDPVQEYINAINKNTKNGQPYKWLGPDGKLSPQDYLDIRNDWIAAGYSPTLFDTKFKGYRNPDNPNYGVTKAPANTKTDGPFD